MRLKLGRRAIAPWESGLEMLDGLKQRIGLAALRRRSQKAEAGAQGIHAPAQALQKMIQSLVNKRKSLGTGCRRNRLPVQQGNEQLPQKDSRDSKTGHHIRQKDRKRSPASPALAAI
jgi:hypothetical protein